MRFARLAVRFGRSVRIDREADFIVRDFDIVYPVGRGRGDLDCAALEWVDDRVADGERAAVDGKQVGLRDLDDGAFGDGKLLFEQVGGDGSVRIEPVGVEVIGICGKYREFFVYDFSRSQVIGDLSGFPGPRRTLKIGDVIGNELQVASVGFVFAFGDGAQDEGRRGIGGQAADRDGRRGRQRNGECETELRRFDGIRGGLEEGGFDGAGSGITEGEEGLAGFRAGFGVVGVDREDDPSVVGTERVCPVLAGGYR